jgi:beta-N-acetylhexosaminidase
VLLMPVDVHEAIEAVTAAVQSGRVSEQRIDASVRRILGAKHRAGVTENRFVDLTMVDRVVSVRAHTELARIVAERSLTLARDAMSLVPLSATTRRVLSITYAGTHDPIAGREFDGELASHGYRVMRERIDDRSTADELAQIAARDADVIIVSAYVSPREGAGTVGTGGGVAAFVESLATSGKRVVVISFGNPYLLTGFPSVPAYLLAWGGAPVSQRSAARALAGVIGIGGRLPISLPPYHVRGDGLQRAASTRAIPNGGY